jgi:tRNA threonylcarbamoyladenosine biosynthesis protein TsaB
VLLLALDTASAAVSVALHDGTSVLAARTGASSPRHVELLTPLVSEALTEIQATASDLTAVAAGLDAPEFLVAIDARRREVYWARYRSDGPFPVRVDGPHVALPADVPRDRLPVVGRGGELYPELLGPAVNPLDPPAADLARLAVQGAPYLVPAEPMYLRRPDASTPGARKRVTP